MDAVMAAALVVVGLIAMVHPEWLPARALEPAAILSVACFAWARALVAGEKPERGGR